MKETLKRLIQEFQENELPQLVQRNISLDLNVPKTITLIGPRRSGKTFLFYQLMKTLIAQGIPKERIMYLNFEDPRLYPFQWKDIDQVIEAYSELFPEQKGDKYVFLDEVQEIDGWEHAVRALSDRPGFRTFLTGSSSKLLSTDIATSLRGRTLSYSIMPFSFSEVLRSNDISVDRRTPYSNKRHVIKKVLEEYMEFGGYPEVVLAQSRDTKVRILREYFNTMIVRDLVERFHIRNILLLKEMTIFLITNMSNLFSISGYHRSVKERHDVSKKTIMTFLSYLEDVHLVFPVKMYSTSLRAQQANPVKVYGVDVGLRTAIGFYTSEEYGKIIENLVFLELMHRKFTRPMMDIFYWRGKNTEVDFVLKEGRDIEELIQVGWSLKDQKTRKRELAGLLEGMEEFGLKEGLLITGDEEGSEKIGNRIINYVPLWKWLITGTSGP